MAIKNIDAYQAEQLLEDIDKLCEVVAVNYLKKTQNSGFSKNRDKNKNQGGPFK